MARPASPRRTRAPSTAWRAERDALRRRLDEAEQALEAIRTGQAESLVVDGPDGPRIFSLEGADHAYRVIVETMNEGAATLDERGTVLYCNNCFAAMLGAPLERVMGDALARFVPEGSRPCFAALMRDAARGASRGELALRDHAGQPVPAYLSISAIPGEPEGRRRYCLIATDLRAQKRNEQIVAAERLARSVLEQSADAIVVCDERGRIVRVSDSARPLCTGDPLGAPFDEVVPLVLAARGRAGSHEPRGLVARALRGEVLRAVAASLTRADGARAELLVSARALHGDAEQTFGCVVTLVDVTEHRRADEALRRSEERLRLAQQVARAGAFEADLGTGVRRWSSEMEALYGLPPGGFGGQQSDWIRLVHPDDAPRILRLIEQSIATREVTEGEWRAVWPDGSMHWLSGRWRVFADDAGTPVRIAGLNIDITERKRAEAERERLLAEIHDLNRNLEQRVEARTREIALARNRLDGIIASATDAIVSVDDAQRVTIFNEGAEKMFGWSRDEVLGQPLDLLLPESLRAGHRAHVADFAREAATARRMAVRRAVTGLRKGGEQFAAEATISKLRHETGHIFTVILRDVTERTRFEEERARALKERETLLKEVHHRVKNNLQVLSSLFYLQEQRTDHPTFKRLLEESRNRIQSIALIHEQLYRSDRLARISFGDYLEDLTRNLLVTIGDPARGVHVRVEAAGVYLDIERAMPCALIVNELVSNALRHAFPAGRGGEIRVAAALAAPGTLRLEVSDTGIGLPPELDFRATTTLGLQLVCSLATQLRGTIELHREGGTRFELRLPLP